MATEIYRNRTQAILAPRPSISDEFEDHMRERRERVARKNYRDVWLIASLLIGAAVLALCVVGILAWIGALN